MRNVFWHRLFDLSCGTGETAGGNESAAAAKTQDSSGPLILLGLICFVAMRREARRGEATGAAFDGTKRVTRLAASVDGAAADLRKGYGGEGQNCCKECRLKAQWAAQVIESLLIFCCSTC